jgi:hypothetical protein
MSSLHHVVNAVASVHRQVEQNIVTLKHPGPPIKLQGLAVVINNLDVENIDTTGAADLRQEKEPSDRREALSRDGSDDIFTRLPPLTKSKLEAKGMHTQSLRPTMTPSSASQELWFPKMPISAVKCANIFLLMILTLLS